MKIECIPIMNLKKHGATSQMLILDNSLHILLDCGLNQKLDFQRYNLYWKQYLSKVNIILLSHTGVEYTGALPFIIEKLQDKQPQIFCTSPIKKFGFVNLYDAFFNIICSQGSEEDSKYSNENNEKFFSNIYSQFDQCEEIKFQQNHKIKLPKNIFNKEIIISCQGIGNSLGACAWTIKCNLINIMYLVTYNHYQELHLSGIDFKQLLKIRIDVLVTDTNHNENQDPLIVSSADNRSQLKQEIKQKITQILDNDGVLVIACYPNERIAEIVFILHELFKEEPDLFKQYKVDFYKNYKSYLEAFETQSSFMSMQAEQLIQQPFQSPFLQKEVEDEQRQRIQPFLNVRQALIPDNQETNKIILTTYNVMFIGPLYQFLLNYSSNQNNQLMIIGRPDQELYEATLKIKPGFQGLLQLQRGEKDIPKLSALENYYIKDKDKKIKKLQNLEGDDNIDDANTETDIQTFVSKNQTIASINTVLIGQQKQQQQKKEEQQQQKSKEQVSQEILQALQDPLKSFKQLQEEPQQLLEEQEEQQQQQQQQQQPQNLLQIDEFDNFSDLQDREQFQELQKEVLFQSQKQFPRFYSHPQKITFTEYGHDTEGEIQGKLRTDNIASFVKQGQIKEQNQPQKFKIANQLFQNFISIDFLEKKQKTKQELMFNMQVSEYPMKGISDFKSAVNIITLINPKHVILVNGQKQENQNMFNELCKRFEQDQIYLPDLTTTTATFEIQNESLDIENFTLKEVQSLPQQLAIDNQNQDSQNQQNNQIQQIVDNKDSSFFFKKVRGELILKFYKESQRTEISLNLQDKNYREQTIEEDTNKINQVDQEQLLFKRSQEIIKNTQNMSEIERNKTLQQLKNDLMEKPEEEQEKIQELETLSLLHNNSFQENDLVKQQNSKLKKKQSQKQSEFYGEFKFDQLMQIIVEKKIKCSISSGKLSLYDGQIQIIRKDDQFLIEGVYSPEYFTVRKILFQFLQQSVKL